MNELFIKPYFSNIQIKKSNINYYGIINTISKEYITIFLTDIIDGNYLTQFFNYIDCWWKNTNHTIPLSIFNKSLLKNYQYCIKTIDIKSVEKITGYQGLNLKFNNGKIKYTEILI